jgi:hypothetical protein
VTVNPQKLREKVFKVAVRPAMPEFKNMRYQKDTRNEK